MRLAMRSGERRRHQIVEDEKTASDSVASLDYHDEQQFSVHGGFRRIFHGTGRPSRTGRPSQFSWEAAKKASGFLKRWRFKPQRRGGLPLNLGTSGHDSVANLNSTRSTPGVDVTLADATTPAPSGTPIAPVLRQGQSDPSERDSLSSATHNPRAQRRVVQSQAREEHDEENHDDVIETENQDPEPEVAEPSQVEVRDEEEAIGIEKNNADNDPSAVDERISDGHNATLTALLEPLQTHIDMDYSSGCLHSSEDSVYFSTAHYELSDPALFKPARSTLDRLKPDLEPILGKLRRFANADARHTISLAVLELRLAGRLLETDNKVRLFPSVWILCHDRTARRKIQRRLDELSWLKSSSYSPVYVRPGLRLGAAETLVSSEVLDLTQGTTFHMKDSTNFRERQVHVHVESSEYPFACGSLCCITITEGHCNEVVHQRLSRIGGYITVETSTGTQVVAVTTGHGLLQPWIEQTFCEDTLGDTAVAPSREMTVFDRDDAMSGVGAALDNSHMGIGHSISHAKTNIVTKWTPATFFPGNINFVYQAIPTVENSFDVISGGVNADFLLLSVDVQADFSSSAEINDGVTSDRVVDHVSDDILSSSVVSGSIAGPEPGLFNAIGIFPDVVPLHINGIVFPTRKVQLPRPLDMGASGSWVVHDSSLCGVIIAVFENEPFALILTAEKLFSDIKEFSSDISGVMVSAMADLTSAMPEPQSTQPVIMNGHRELIQKDISSISVGRSTNRNSLSDTESGVHKPTLNLQGKPQLSQDSLFYPRPKTSFGKKRVSSLAHHSVSWIGLRLKKFQKFRTRKPNNEIQVPTKLDSGQRKISRQPDGILRVTSGHTEVQSLATTFYTLPPRVKSKRD